MKKINIAIDGPSAAGKSTISKGIAKKLGYVHIDTGSMYRSVAYKAKQLNVNWEDEDKLVSMLLDTSIVLEPSGKIILDGKDVSFDIRQNDISLGASAVSKHGRVRKELVRRQQEMAKAKGFVMDGRDIGTVVLTDAELKIYQTATAETRAKRRYEENLEKGIACDYESILKDVEQRDYQDMNRAESPLKQAEDAIVLDTSDLSIEEAIDKVYQLAIKKINEE